MRYTAYALTLICILLKQRYSFKTFVLLSAVMLIVTLSMLRSQDKTLFLYTFLLIAAMELNSEDLIKYIFVIQALVWAAALLSSLLGFVEDYYWVQGERIRHSLGFEYTTIAPVLYYYMILEYLFLKKGKLLFRKYILLMSVAVYFYYATRTRMIFGITVCTLTFFLFYTRFWGRGTIQGAIIKRIRLLVVAAPFIAFFVSLWAALSYNDSNEIWQFFNSLLSGRLSLSQKGFDAYGITLFGQPIDWIASNIQTLLHGYREIYNYVDCSYLQILYEHGILSLLLILTAYAALLKKALEWGKYYLVWIILLILIHAMVEPFLINLSINPFLLVLMAKWNRTSEVHSVQEVQRNIEKDKKEWQLPDMIKKDSQNV